MTDLKDLLPALERWEDELWRHEEITGAAVLNGCCNRDGARRAGDAPETACRQVRYVQSGEVNYVDLKLPHHPIDMLFAARMRRRATGMGRGIRKKKKKDKSAQKGKEEEV